ncbi:MAG: DUF3365 domain-containing protein [Kangiellaceae bacterium]|jgi:cytochrome c553|nr:DUF3365 domain-containing protein [Kangiellaceae bacterium]
MLRQNTRATASILLSIVIPFHIAGYTESASIDEAKMSAGYSSYKAMCTSCHSGDLENSARIAPPFSSIKQHYVSENVTFEEFRKRFVGFVNNPTAKNAQMKGAIKRFGLMPKMSFSEEITSDIAYYVYHTPLELPNWFNKHSKGEELRYKKFEKSSPNSLKDYLLQGQNFAMQTKSALGSKLKKALKDGGPKHAVTFCKTEAIPITKMMSNKLGATIKRVSDRPRNPSNMASDEELLIINSLKQTLADGSKLVPIVKNNLATVKGYYPIVTNGMCLSCHGSVKETIVSETLSAINEEYPEDRATGYGLNEIRGLFVVEMKKKAQPELK